MQTLMVDSFLDEVKTAPWNKALRDAIREELRSSLEVVPYTDFTPDFVDKHIKKFDAVVLSGSDACLSRAEDRFAFGKTIEAVRMLNLPVLGICGGHQLIAVAHGEKIVNMGRSIEGFCEVRVLVDDPLFNGLPEKIVVRQSHEEMIERLPKGYSKMAESPETPIEAMKRTEKLVTYGVQFHPEIHDAEHPAGKFVLSNFAKIASQ